MNDNQIRGDLPQANNDRCLQCGVFFMCDHESYADVTFPIAPTFKVQCFCCDHSGPISEWWNEYDRAVAAGLMPPDRGSIT